jgi:hypothetical protein
MAATLLPERHYNLYATIPARRRVGRTAAGRDGDLDGCGGNPATDTRTLTWTRWHCGAITAWRGAKQHDQRAEAADGIVITGHGGAGPTVLVNDPWRDGCCERHLYRDHPGSRAGRTAAGRDGDPRRMRRQHGHGYAPAPDGDRAIAVAITSRGGRRFFLTAADTDIHGGGRLAMAS